MKPTRTRGHTTNFTPPTNWDEERDGKCGVLSVRREVGGAGHDLVYHYSTWTPTPDELARLAAGDVVELCCVGIQPPVSVSVVPAPAPEVADAG